MEDVLDLYQQVDNPDCPLVCFDEGSKQLLVESHQPYPARPGRPARYDYAYLHAGVCNLFLCFEPLRGKRDVVCCHRRTQRRRAPLRVHRPRATTSACSSSVVEPQLLPPGCQLTRPSAAPP